MHHAPETRAAQVRRYVITRLACDDDQQVASDIASAQAQDELGGVITREDLIAMYRHVRPTLAVASSGLPGVIDHLAAGGLSPGSIVRWLDSPEGMDVVGHRTTAAELISLLRQGRSPTAADSGGG